MGPAAKRSLVICLLSVMLIAALLRIGFALVVVRTLDPAAFRSIHGDTNGYMRLAQRIIDGYAYAAVPVPADGGPGEYYELNRRRLRALARPPGYPLFLAAHERLGGVSVQADVRPVAWTQAAFSVLTVGMIAYLAFRILGHVAASWTAGLLGALSPTAIVSPTVITPDSIYAFFCLAGFGSYLLLVSRASSTRRRILCAALAGVMFAIAVSLKPAIGYWPVVAAPLLFLARGWTLASLRDLLLAFLPLALVMVFWTLQNYQREGIVTYSTIATRNLHYDVTVRAKLTEEGGGIPNERKYRQAVKLVTDRDNAILRSSNPDLVKLDRDMRSGIREGFIARPRATARVLLSNLWDQSSTGWFWIDEQVPEDVTGARFIHSYVRLTTRKMMVFLWFAGIAAALPICLIRRDRAALLPLTVCLLGALYIAAGTATIHGEGSRLMTAAEPLALLLITATLCHGVEVIRKGWRIGAGYRSKRVVPMDV